MSVVMQRQQHGSVMRRRSTPRTSVSTRASSSSNNNNNSPAVLRRTLDGPAMTKLDPGDDRNFYAVPRMVKHVDDTFLAQVTELYRQRIPTEEAAVFDMCSSWVSHLPSERDYSFVAAHGMNAAELAANRQLDQFFVRNLNKDRSPFPHEDNTFDAVLCCVSIQYMQYPEEVLAECLRILKPGGCVIITFSNRLFYQKAVAAWRDATGYARCQLVCSYLRNVKGYTEPETILEVPLGDGPLLPSALQSAPSALQQAYLSAMDTPVGKAIRRLAERSANDPFYAIVSYKSFKRIDDE